MTLELRPEIADRLAALASVRGQSVEDYLKDLVEREPPALPLAKTAFEQGLGLFGSPEDVALLDRAVRPKHLTAAEWARQFEEWADSFPDAPPIPDEALSRETLYPDRW